MLTFLHQETAMHILRNPSLYFNAYVKKQPEAAYALANKVQSVRNVCNLYNVINHNVRPLEEKCLKSSTSRMKLSSSDYQLISSLKKNLDDISDVHNTLYKKKYGSMIDYNCSKSYLPSVIKKTLLSIKINQVTQLIFQKRSTVHSLDRLLNLDIPSKISTPLIVKGAKNFDNVIRELNDKLSLKTSTHLVESTKITSSKSSLS